MGICLSACARIGVFAGALLGKGLGTCRRLVEVEVEAWGLSGQTFPVGFAVGRLRFRMAGAAETRSITGESDSSSFYPF